jgi:hypothetical protein
MNKELIIEHYLSQLDRELQALPTGQRAEIITEIRSHILEASEKDSSKPIQTLLNDMGTPRDVAIKYLQQKGVKHWVPAKSRNWLRVLALSVAAMFAFVVLSTAFTVWYFSPLIHVDEEQGRVTLLGGFIDVNDKTDEVKVGSMKVKGSMKGHVQVGSGSSTVNINLDDDGDGDYDLKLTGSKSEGQEDLTGKNVKTIKIPFNTAKLELNASESQHFTWECENLGSSNPPLSVKAGVLTFDLNMVKMARCELGLPEGVKAEIKGINGSLELNEPNTAYDINVTNAKINISQDSSKIYDFEVKVANGTHDNFGRSTDKKALKMKVDVVNGVVQKN